MGLGGGYLASVGAKKVSENKHDVYLSLGECLFPLSYAFYHGHLRADRERGGTVVRRLMTAVSWTLTVVMGIRFMRKWSFMPAGLSKSAFWSSHAWR